MGGIREGKCLGLFQKTINWKGLGIYRWKGSFFIIRGLCRKGRCRRMDLEMMIGLFW